MSEPPQECARLAAELRTCRERAGLSLAALAAKSAYSKSSWHRFLSGAVLPPWPVVQSLAQLADVPEARLRALWELAEAAWSRRDIVVSAADASTEPAMSQVATRPSSPTSDDGTETALSTSPTSDHGGETAPARGTRLRRTVRSVVALAALAAAVTALAAIVEDRREQARPATTPAALAFHVGCTRAACDGRDPGTMGCGVAPQTLTDHQVPDGASLEIRYNPDCNAVWARMWNTHIGDVLTLVVPHGPNEQAQVRDSASREQFTYTPLDGLPTRNLTVTACLASAAPGGAGCVSVVVP